MFVLDDIAAFDRIRISGLMASQVEALMGGLDALARLKASKQVAEYLAQLGVTLTIPKEPLDGFSIADRVSASEALDRYLETGLHAVPDALRPFEAMTVGELASTAQLPAMAEHEEERDGASLLDAIEYTDPLQVELVQLLSELPVCEGPSRGAKAQRLMDLIPQVMFDTDEQENAAVAIAAAVLEELAGEDDLALDAVPTPAANLARGLASLQKSLTTKATVHRTMYREGLGWIDFEWGDEGKPANAKGVRKGGKGLVHAIEARGRKDGYTAAQVDAMLKRMVTAIANGTLPTPPVEVGPVKRVVIVKDGLQVQLVKRQGSNAWVLTVFDLHE